ncbi:MAG TPA: TRAM domain-containing protein [Vicinamibacteria bacterium]|nr:TRAM domain-containing protein [Vicinamibacteria bacterium]
MNHDGLDRGDTCEVVVEKAIYRGLGLARHQGQVVLVRRGLPGDRARVRVEKAGRGFVEAGIDAVLAAAPRRSSPCPLFARCGGCAYQDVDYARQLELKQAILRESLLRAGAPWEGDIELHASPESGWRTRATLHLGPLPDGGTGLGLHQPGSHRLVDLSVCEQLTPLLQRTQRALLDGLRDHPHRARVQHIHLAQGLAEDGVVAVLDGDLDPPSAASFASLGRSVPWLSGLGAVCSRGPFVSLNGSPYVHSTVLGHRFRVHARAFFQGNGFLVEELARTVSELLPAGGTVLDLYAGVGLFSLTQAPHAEAVVAVEGNAHAAADALANARSAGLSHVQVRRGELLESLRRIPARTEERIVLDPPRTGAGPRVVEAIVRRGPAAVVYVSCDPPTLGRDLVLFGRAGLVPDSVHVFDLFPDTFHLETVVRLTARSGL